MTEDVLERLERSNPVGTDPVPPPIAVVRERIQAAPRRRWWSLRDRHGVRRSGSPLGRGPALLPTLGTLTTLAVVALALVLAGHRAPPTHPGTGAKSNGLLGVVTATGSFTTDGRGVVSLAQCWPCRANPHGGEQVEHYLTLATTDGGRSWRRAQVPPGLDVASAGQFNLGSAQFDANGDVWAVSSYTTRTGMLAFAAAVSPNGGLRWTRAHGPVPGFIGSVSVAGNQAWATSGGYCRGRLCAGAEIFLGPASSSILGRIQSEPWPASSLLRITAASRDSAYVQVFTKSQGTRTLATRDGGRSWQQLASFCPNTGPDLIFRASGPRSIWAVCPVAGASSLLERSGDGGQHWRRYRIPAHGGIENLMPVSADAAWAISDSGYVTVSDDGGAHWRTVWSAGDYRPRAHLPTISPAGATRATITATQTSGGRTRVILYRTHDGGRTWQRSVVPLR